MAELTPYAGIIVPVSTDPRQITRDLNVSFTKVDSVLAQQGGESSAALTAGQAAEALAAQALARALAIEDPIHVGPSEPTEGEALWLDTDEDAPPNPVTASDITDATDLGRRLLTSQWSTDARNALSIFTGTRALLDAGTDTAERTWDAKELHEYVTETAEAAGGAGSWDDLTGKPTAFPPEAHTHAVGDVEGLLARLAALEYKSGLRSFEGLLYDGFTVAWFYAARDATMISVHVTNITYSGSATGTVSVALLPAGFRPYATVSGTTTRGKGVLITSSGVVQITGTPSASVDSFSFTYLTPDPVPSIPPGDPA